MGKVLRLVGCQDESGCSKTSKFVVRGIGSGHAGVVYWVCRQHLARNCAGLDKGSGVVVRMNGDVEDG